MNKIPEKLPAMPTDGRLRCRKLALKNLGCVLPFLSGGVTAFAAAAAAGVFRCGKTESIILLGLSAMLMAATIAVMRTLKRLERTSQRQMMERIVQAVEQDRGRISRELHDSVGQALYSVLIGIKVVAQYKTDDSVKEHFLQAERLTARALQEVKRIAHELRPPELDQMDLYEALGDYLERYEYTFGIRAVLEQEGKARRYGRELESVLYRIAQEALTNAAKYAETPRVDVRLVHGAKSVELIVRDYGKGLPPDLPDNDGGDHSGIGLASIRERAASVGGRADIASRPGQGVTVSVRVPV